MAVLNYAQQYSKELAQAYPYVLYSGALFGFGFTGVRPKN